MPEAPVVETPVVEAPAVEAPVVEAPAEVVPDQKPVEEAPAEPAEPAETKTEQPPEKPGKSRFERRLDRAYRAKAEAEAKADFLQRQIEEMKQVQAPKAPGAPTLEQHNFDPEAYAKAYGEYEKQETIKQLQETQQRQAAQYQAQALSTAWAEKAARGDTKYDDFHEVVGDLPPNNVVAAAIMQAENGEDIAYHLFKDGKKEAMRIAKLDLISQIREIGRIEAKLALEPEKPKAPSSAPAPIKPVGGSSSPSTKKLSEMTQEEFEKRRRAIIAARR